MSVTRARQSAISSLRGQAAAGEDVGVGEAAGALLGLVDAVVDRDRLQQHQPVGAEQLAAAAEEVVEVLPADRLDHLDRDQPVVAAAQVAVVLAAAPSTRSLEAGLAHPPAGQLVLLGGRSSSSSPGSRARGRRGSPARPSRCRSPAGGSRARAAARSQIRSQLRQLRLLEAGALAREVGARVHHPLVEEGGEEVVAEVVVGGDVPAGPGRGCSRGPGRGPGAARPRGRATAPRTPSSSRSSRAAMRISATRSSVSQRPST